MKKGLNRTLSVISKIAEIASWIAVVAGLICFAASFDKDFIEMMIAEIDGEKPNPLNITDFVKNLPMMDTNYIVKHCQKINESVGLDTLLNNTCDVCGLDYETRFRTNSGFFGPDINI